MYNTFAPNIDYSRVCIVEKKQDISDRIREIASAHGLTVSTLADALSFPRSTIHTIVTEGREVKHSLFLKLIDKFPEISVTWLLTGSGSMLSDEAERIKQLEAELADAKQKLRMLETIEKLRQENAELKKN